MKVRCLSIVSRGTEDIAAREIKEICGSTAKIKDGCVEFEANGKEELCAVAYLSQSSERVLLLYDSFTFEADPFGKIKDSLKKISIPPGSYKVHSIRRGEHSFNSDDVMKNVGSCLHDMGRECDLRNPKNLIVVFINNNACSIGLDITQMDLHKREYRIFTTPSDIRATVAYSMVRLSGFREGEILLDPFCNSGTICIEAALFATKRPVRFYEKAKFGECSGLEKIDKKIRAAKSRIVAVDANNRNVACTKKNAKIAGVIKDITFSRSDVEWMDIKFEKNSIHCIVTKLPDIRKDGNREKMLKIYNEFFYNSEYVIRQDGMMVIMTESIDALSPIISKYGFTVREKREVAMGKETRHVYIIVKCTNNGTS
ncbi:hypothetical protein HY638_01495 [Candidatus Woesearchaeota archaeon]|nr:hypothetical protein [Candidatus Woesearchaeota archaeon]